MEGFGSSRRQRRLIGDFCDVLSTSGGSVRIADSSFIIFSKIIWLDVALGVNVSRVEISRTLQEVVTPCEISVLTSDLESMD